MLQKLVNPAPIIGGRDSPIRNQPDVFKTAQLN
jgi:hypothetical protein